MEHKYLFPQDEPEDEQDEQDEQGDSVDMYPESCPICSGDGYYIGSLGFINYYRCQYCGMEFSC